MTSSFILFVCLFVCNLEALLAELLCPPLSVGRSVKKMQKVQKWEFQSMSTNIKCFNGGRNGSQIFLTVPQNQQNMEIKAGPSIGGYMVSPMLNSLGNASN